MKKLRSKIGVKTSRELEEIAQWALTTCSSFCEEY